MEIVLNLSQANSNDFQFSDSNNLQSSHSTTITPIKGCFTIDSIHHVNDHLNKLLKEKFNDATVIISVVILILINLVVIAGNILVILSVLTSNKLRTVTNFFIVSLAVADFLVGIAVLPYSLTLEILDTWIFGELWCQGWLVIDVWMCTASILNLCAISVDRYLAVTQPVRYRSLMTPRRAKFIIAAVWILSFIICFPGLVVQSKSLVSRNALSKQQNPSTYKLPSILPDSFTIPNTKAPQRPITPSTTASLTPSPLLQSLTLNDITDDPNLSSTNLFRASETLLLDDRKAISNNSNIIFLTQSTVSNNSNSLYTLSKSNTPPNTSNTEACNFQPVQCALFTNKSYVIYSAFGSFFIPMFVMIFFYWRIYLVAIRTTRALKRGYRTTKSSGDGTNEERLTLRIHRGYATDENIGDKCQIKSTVQKNQGKSSKISGTKSKTLIQYKSRIPITIYKASKPSKSNLTVNNLSISGSAKCNTLSPSAMVEINGRNRRNSPGCQSTLSLPSSSSPSSSREGSAKSNKAALSRLSKRTSKYQAKRFHAETKAAKTVGIIVGGFIVCWLPFFTVYLIKAFCENCIPDLLFSIFFWLGYCNSMINPCIYGLFSKDFRRAFKNIICRCKFQEETSVSSLIRQIHMPTFFEDMPEEMEAKHESQDY